VSERYRIVDHGIRFPGFHPSVSLAGTPFAHVQIGVGQSFKEAYEDALDLIHCWHGFKADWIGLPLFYKLPPSLRGWSTRCQDDKWWYVSIYYNLEEEAAE
jgi:hypothetical protein